jgi:hypothetical protein
MPAPEAEDAIRHLYNDGWLDVVDLEDVRIAFPGLDEFIKRRAPLT